MNIILTPTTLALKAVLSEGITTTNPDFLAAYVDVMETSFVEGSNDGALNGVTAVELLAAPAALTTRVIQEIIIHNKDTVTHTITILINNGAQVIWRGTLLTLETYSFDGTYDATGRRKIV